MSRRQARIIQADVARAWRAAISVDPKSSVEIMPDGRIRIVLAERNGIGHIELRREITL